MASIKIDLSIPPFQTQKTSHFSKTHLSNSPISISQPITIKRKNFNLSVIALILSHYLPFATPNAIANDEEQERGNALERYTDSNLGFTLLRPSSYIKVDKAGATVLFEEENKGANNVGVVVDPVRLTSLRDFGTPQFVAEKLIQAEKRKPVCNLSACTSHSRRSRLCVEPLVAPVGCNTQISMFLESTKDAKVVGVSQRPGIGGIPVYEFEYIVDSTRGGMKRVFTAAFVSGNNLYLLNISHADKPESPLDSRTRMMLEKVLHSFDATPLT